MSGSIRMELYLHAYKMEALSSVLADQGSSVEKRMQEMLIDLYAELVPVATQQEICTRIDAEHAAGQAAQEMARKFTAFRLRQDGADEFFEADHGETFLDVAKFLRSYLWKQKTSAADALKNFLCDLKPITAGQYDQRTALRMENPQKVAGVFDLDFDRQTVSVVDPADGWRTYGMKDVSAAVYYAYRKNYLDPEQYKAQFAEKLAGWQISSAGHLSTQEISFADEISEMDNLLNFYMETNFDVDAVFGTHVCTSENNDWLNVYANYDMVTGRVCDVLEIAFHRGNGGEESLTYSLNAVESTVLLRKMDAYCQQQTGQTLEEYSAQLMTEEITPAAGPVM